MPRSLADALAARLGVAVSETRRVGGGDISDAFDLRLADGRRLFAKTRAGAPPAMFRAEAQGLAWLAEARALRLPRVVDASDGEHGVAYLALEYIDSAPRGPAFDEQFGRGLATLHRAGAPGFGLDHDNFIGPLPQPNAPLPEWSRFYGEQRLLPQISRAVDGGRVPRAWLARVERLCGRLAALVGPPDAPARLHGDLWSGNVLSDERGAPVLIDPAVHGGHREVDLAMLQLFGRPAARFFSGYDEVWPRDAGHVERVALYQLYPLLVHVNLFGGGYVEAVDTALRAYE